MDHRIIRCLQIALAMSVAAGATAGSAEDLADVERLYATGTCSNCQLDGLILGEGDFSFFVMSGSSLYGAVFLGSNLASADLSAARLRKATLRSANLSGARLNGADLSGADLRLAQLDGADLVGVITDEQTICPDATHGPCRF
ncbi:MAG: pentapeptide repeat-containing protein [Steroidobacteraceae bacterium]|nr:pentapeptide repeat-containing protein [Steroidobacteraceae bacterium]